MANLKVSQLPLLGSGALDPAADLLLVSDVSAALSKKIKPSELFKGALPFAEPVFDFAKGTLPPNVSFTRASAGYRYNSAGVLVAETTDVARFQYDPVALTPRGLLAEAASSGLLTYSEQFDNAAWTKTRASITANAVAAPDGTTTADKLVEDGTATSSHSVQQSPTFVSGTTYAFSVFVKADTRSRIYMQLPSTAFTSTLRTWFDIGGGTVGTTAAGCTAFIRDVGGGWYRCAVICTATASAAGTALICLAIADAGVTYSGDATSGLYLWGANIRAEDRLTSYVQVAASPVVRSADVVLIDNPHVLTDQCWIIRGRTPRKISGGTANTVFHVDDGTSNNRRFVYYNTDGTLRASARVGGVSQCDLNLGAVAADTDFTVAVRWADNNFAASLNGGAIVTDVSGTNPLGLTTARVGTSVNLASWNSTIRTIETRRTASDTELPLLSS